MRRAVDAQRQPRHDGESGLREGRLKLARVDQALRRRVAAADDGDATWPAASEVGGPCTYSSSGGSTVPAATGG
jgi:hypothetical protein